MTQTPKAPVFGLNGSLLLTALLLAPALLRADALPMPYPHMNAKARRKEALEEAKRWVARHPQELTRTVQVGDVIDLHYLKAYSTEGPFYRAQGLGDCLQDVTKKPKANKGVSGPLRLKAVATGTVTLKLYRKSELTLTHWEHLFNVKVTVRPPAKN